MYILRKTKPKLEGLEREVYMQILGRRPFRWRGRTVQRSLVPEEEQVCK